MDIDVGIYDLYIDTQIRNVYNMAKKFDKF
jgi:hypothetical protein